MPNDPTLEPTAAPALPGPEPDLDTSETALDDAAVDVGRDEKMVPLSAVTRLRDKMQTQRAETKVLRERLTASEAELRTAAPLVDVAKALLDARQPAAAMPAVDDTEAAALATSLQLYTDDGRPDVQRGAALLEVITKRAEAQAQATVRPVHQQALEHQAAVMFERAQATKDPSGAAPDPEVLRQVFSRVDPSVSSTPQGAQWLWVVAMGLSQLKQKSGTPHASASPLFSERAGGQAAGSVALTDRDRRVAQDLGMSASEFSAAAASMPWRRS